ncbi:MAG: hypothetical protein ACI9TH_000528, partial [Kiritimatiellia bacterium]
MNPFRLLIISISFSLMLFCMAGCGSSDPSSPEDEAPLYHAQARILITLADGETPAPIPIIENERLMLTSRPVLEAFIEKRKKLETEQAEVEVLPEEVSAVARRLAVEHLEGSGVLEIRAAALHPANAAMMANGLIEAYLANRALFRNLDKEADLAAMEQQIQGQAGKLQAAELHLAALEKAHPDAAPADPEQEAEAWIEAMAHARLGLVASEEKMRFMQTVPFSEWGYYTTTFAWNTNFVASLKEHRDASVMEELLARQLGATHEKVLSLRAASEALRHTLEEMAKQMRGVASNEFTQTQAAYETLAARKLNESKPLKINLALNKARRDVAIQETVLDALRAHAEQEVQAVEAYPQDVRIRLLEIA